MDVERQKSTELLLRKFIGSVRPIKIEERMEGHSTLLSLKMTVGDILRLLAAMVDEELGGGASRESSWKTTTRL